MYSAVLTPKTKLFQKPYRVCDNLIFITDTPKSKKRFLKSGIQPVIFGEEFASDALFFDKIEQCTFYDRAFLLNYLEPMLIHLTDYLKKDLPYDEIAIFTHSCGNLDYLTSYARMITFVGAEGENTVCDGVPLRYVKKMKTLPDIAITIDETLSPLFSIPSVNISSRFVRSPITLNWDTLSFKSNILPFEIGAAAVMYFIKKGYALDFELSSMRKKSPPIFSFC